MKNIIRKTKIQSIISYILLCSFLVTALLPVVNVSGGERLPEASVSDSDIGVTILADTDADIVVDTEQVMTMDLTSESVTVAAGTTVGATVAANVSSTLKAIDFYNDEAIAGFLAPSRYTAMADKLNYLKESSYGETFEKVQSDIEQIVTEVVNASAAVSGQSEPVTYYTNLITDNKEKFMIGLSYIYRLYDFNMGTANIKDNLLYYPGTYGKTYDPVSWLIEIGGFGGNNLRLSSNTSLFGGGKPFQKMTSSWTPMTLGDFLEKNREKYIPDKTLDEWFMEESNAYIEEVFSSDAQSTKPGLYTRLYNDSALSSYILPLLTVSKDSIYVIAAPKTITYGLVDCYVDKSLQTTDPVLYGKKMEQFLTMLKSAAKQQNAFVEVWKRLAGPEKINSLNSNSLIIDSLRIYQENSLSVWSEWSPKSGESAAVGVREFITPMGMYASYMFCDGEAFGTGVRMYVSKMLTENGLSTYSHEMTHNWVSNIMLNGYGIRDGMGGEIYTRGMFETSESNDPIAFSMNLVFDRSNYAKRYHNAVPERFRNLYDLKHYMNGILNVVYTLDYAEAQTVLSKEDSDKQKWFHKLEQQNDSGSRYNSGSELQHKLDCVRELNEEEAGLLHTIDDLIDEDIIVSRYEVDGLKTIGTFRYNDYYAVPLFSSNYAAVQNDEGVSGDVMIRRQAFELLAEYGYYEGMVPYISNQYKSSAANDGRLFSDTYILEKVFDGSYDTIKDFKKAMFQRRIDCTEYLKPVTIEWEGQTITIDSFETLQGLMQEAVEWDLENVHEQSNNMNNIRAESTHTEQLKAKIFQAYLFQTDDFKESIYKDGIEPDPEPNPDPDPDPEPNPNPDPEPDPEPNPNPDPDPDPEPNPNPDPDPDPVPNPNPGQGTDFVPEGGPEAVPLSAVGTVITTSDAKYLITQTAKDGGEVTYTKYSGKYATAQVPDSIKIDGVEYSVTAVGKNAFGNNGKLTKVIIGKHVRKIDKKAFYKCKKLKKIIIRSTVLKSVGSNAIKGIHKKAVIKVPKKKYNKYKKLFTAKTGMKKTMSVKK